MQMKSPFAAFAGGEDFLSRSPWNVLILRVAMDDAPKVRTSLWVFEFRAGLLQLSSKSTQKYINGMILCYYSCANIWGMVCGKIGDDQSFRTPIIRRL